MVDELPVFSLDRIDPVRLDAVCRDIGFFIVEDHGIPVAVRDGVFDAARRFFELDPLQKDAVSIARSPCHRGYVAMAHETLDASRPADAKEAFDLSRDLGPGHPAVIAGTPLHGPNQWPELEGFRAATERYFDAGLDAADRIARFLARSLDLNESFFADRIADTMTNLRLLHYPPVGDAATDPDAPGCGEHCDYGMITLLAVDGVAGLQVRMRSGRVIDIDARPDQLVVNLGDLLARWTGGRWVSTPHRVASPVDQHRYSIPLFVNPAFDTVIEPVGAAAGSVASDPAFARVGAGQYLLSRFDATHAYRAAEAPSATAEADSGTVRS